MKFEEKPIEGFEDTYTIDTLGRVKSLRKNCYLKQHTCSGGYRQVALYIGHNPKTYLPMYQHKRVHRLVATHFVKNRWNLPIVKFKDGDRSNIVPSNLEWTDQATELHNPFTDSWNPAKRKLTDEQLADCKQAYINGVGIAELCQKYGVSRSAIERNIFDSSPEILKAKKEHRDRKNKENGFKSRIPILQLDLKGNFIKEWPSSIAAAKALGMNQGNISNALNGFIQSTGGFKWVKKSSRFNPLHMQKQK